MKGEAPAISIKRRAFLDKDSKSVIASREVNAIVVLPD